MMDGSFGVFDGLCLLAEFSDDEAADRYRRDVLQLDFPDGYRRSEYDDLLVAEIPEDYSDAWPLLIKALRRSRQQDRTVEKCIAVLRAAQEVRHDAKRM